MGRPSRLAAYYLSCLLRLRVFLCVSASKKRPTKPGAFFRAAQLCRVLLTQSQGDDYVIVHRGKKLW